MQSNIRIIICSVQIFAFSVFLIFIFTLDHTKIVKYMPDDCISMNYKSESFINIYIYIYIYMQYIYMYTYNLMFKYNVYVYIYI